MRFIHISDLHIGKRLNETDLSADIEHALFEEILGRIYNEAAAEKPVDALIIAGDIYDRSLPSAESEEVFGRLLTRAVKLGMRVFVISGNHDSARRVASNEELLSRLGIFISRPFSAENPVRVEQLGEFDVAMLPFVSLADVRGAYPDEDIPDITAAIAAVLKHSGLPGERPCILAAHQAVGLPGDRLVGMAESADVCVLDGFAYVCLGHIHTPRSVGERARYCGSPVCYSGTEAKNPRKYCDIVDIEPDGSVSARNIPIKPLHEFRVFEGSFAQLMSENYPRTDAYCYITVSGIDGVEGVAAQLRTKFPNMLALHHKTADSAAGEQTADSGERDFSEDFRRFYRSVTHSDISEDILRSAEYVFRLTEEAFSNGTTAELEAQKPRLWDEEARNDS